MKKSILLLVALISTILPKASFAQAQEPDLGITTGFALFTAAGAINNSGTSSVVGNVGNDAGAFNGLPPGMITGQTHIQDSVSAIANIDVHAADNFLSALANDSVVVSTVLGNGQVLTSGVYKMGTAPTATASLLDTLFLDGQGDSNAVFIIKITGAFVTGTGSQVVAINSALLKNVYWQIGGQVDLGTASHFGGTIIANGAIIFASGAELTGRALGLASAFTLNNNTVTNPEAFQGVPLSMDFVKLSVVKEGGSALLKWTASHTNGAITYTAERSTNGQAASWKPVGTVNTAATAASDFSLVDNNVTRGANYYRLRATSPDGTTTFSNTEEAYFDRANTAAISIYPNPVKNSFTVAGATPGSTIMVLDLAGKVLMSQAASTNGANLLPASDLAPGTYLLKVQSTDGTIITTKLSK
jgi:hypothetical protein